MGHIPRGKEKSLPMRYQAKLIDREYPEWKVRQNYGELAAIGEIQPTAYSPKYLVKIAFRRSDSIPQVTLLSPEIQERNHKLPPHLLSKKKKTLCLCYPKLKEWKKTDIIAQTIIPRISLWLYYYEHWLQYGKWLGGGTVHPKDKPIEIEDFVCY